MSTISPDGWPSFARFVGILDVHELPLKLKKNNSFGGLLGMIEASAGATNAPSIMKPIIVAVATRATRVRMNYVGTALLGYLSRVKRSCMNVNSKSSITRVHSSLEHSVP